MLQRSVSSPYRYVKDENVIVPYSVMLVLGVCQILVRLVSSLHQLLEFNEFKRVVQRFQVKSKSNGGLDRLSLKID